MRIAILDDYLNQSQRAADWSTLAKTCEITVFDRPVGAAEAAEVLKPFDVICLLRERTPFPRGLIEALPNLKMLAVTGLYNRTLESPPRPSAASLSLTPSCGARIATRPPSLRGR